MEVGATFVADDEAAELVDPGEGPLHDPAAFARMGAAFDAAAGDAGLDVAAAEFASAEGVAIGLVGVELFRPFARASAPSSYRLDGVDDGRRNLAVAAVGAARDDGERKAASVDDDMALRPRPAAVGRVRADRFTPFLAATGDESAGARDPSISPARPGRSSMWRWMLSQSPTSRQALRLGRQLMPEQPVTSNGGRSHGVAVESASKTPISASPPPTGGRPPLRARSISCKERPDLRPQRVGKKSPGHPHGQPNIVNKGFCWRLLYHQPF